MALDFPASPNINDTYTFGGVTWTYDGTTWKVLGRFQFTSSETDPIFTGSPSFGILNQNINNWNAAHGWGDHSQAGYLTSASSSDTLDTVTGRGATTTNNVSVGDLTVSGANGISIGDANANIARFGNDLRIFVSGSNDLNTFANVTTMKVGSNADKTALKLTSPGAVELYYDSTKKFETTTTGVTISGDIALGSGDLTTTGKIYYSNNFANSVDLPSASTYHGMFAHVHAENHGYFAHAGAWTQLLDTGSNLSELADVATTAPSTSDVLTWDGANWGPAAPTGGGGGANVTIADTAPGSASAGDLWWESDKGRLKIYYNDTDSTQWVDASPPLTNANVPMHVGEVELWQGGNQITWLGSNGVTAAIRATEGGGGFQSPCIRVTFTQAFSSSDSYTVQATVYNPSQIGDVYQTSIRKTGPAYFDFQVYNLTDSVVATDFKVAITIYAI
jgi:hypothetical protein